MMWSLALAIYSGCKWLTWRRTRLGRAPLWRHLSYLAAWPGLDAKRFIEPGAHSIVTPPPAREWLVAGARLVVGAGILFGGARFVPSGWPYLIGWVGMIGMVLILHFGLFHLVSCGWRSLGVDARPLMSSPLASASAAEFWGVRWNSAFRDLTYRFMFRPLATRKGSNAALLLSFLASGLVHEIVISLPAGGGYGGPTLFFLIQAAAIQFERSRTGVAIGLGGGWRGWLYVKLVLAAPAYLLFHLPFVLKIVVPFMRDIGAL